MTRSAPSDRTISTFSVLHTPVPSAPSDFAICTANVPMPPAAPLIKTFCPGVTVAFIPKPLQCSEPRESARRRLAQRQVVGLRHQRALGVPVVHAGFEKVAPVLYNAGNDSRHLEELTTCNSGGSDSPKVRTASERSGGIYFDRSWTVSSAVPSAIKREIACSRIASSMSREGSSVRR